MGKKVPKEGNKYKKVQKNLLKIKIIKYKQESICRKMPKSCADPPSVPKPRYITTFHKTQHQ